MPRMLIAGMWQETNTYSSRHTTLNDYEDFELVSGPDVLALHQHQRSVIGGFLSVLGDSAVAGLSAAAWPAGLTPQPVFESLMARFEEAIAPHRGVDAVLLNLHGAMVADGHPDVELDVVRLTRRVVGDVPIVAVLDFHANPSTAFMREIDALTSYRTYPHVDMFERGVEAAQIARRIVESGERWRVSSRKLPLITSPLTQASTDSPMSGLLRLRTELSDVSTTVSAMPGFAYSDVSRGGFTVASSSPGGSNPAVERLAEAAWASRDTFAASTASPRDAVARARALSSTTVLADIGDNIGGGSPGEGTVLLDELLRARSTSAVVVIADPGAVAQAIRSGVGSRTGLQIGGHWDDLHGPTLSVSADVVSLSDGRYVASGSWMGGHTFSMGPTAVVRVGGVTVILTTVATPPFHREQITSQGLEPRDFSVVVAKGAIAWQDALADIAGGAIFVDTPGSTPAFPESLARSARAEDGSPWVFPSR